jgi:UDP-N-acetylmuramoyl-L-alanyl-D-glutamate--2,6-diaminopimelate ligase
MNGRRTPRVPLRELLTDVDVLEWSADPRVEISAIVHDSHAVTPGACFACIPGAVTDGHEHAPDAVAAGAVALLVERMLALDASQARVAAVRPRLGSTTSRPGRCAAWV